MVDAILKWTGVAACILVLGGAVCRIWLMQARRNRFAWFLVYVAMAVFALGTALDLVIGYRVSWYTVVGIGCLLLYVLLTRGQWLHGPPPETCSRRGELRRRDGGAA